MKHEYPIQIGWSDEDEAYIAGAVGLPGCVADGKSPEQAIVNLRTIIQEWIEVAKEEGRDVPAPMNCRDIDELYRKSQSDLQKHIEKEVKKVVATILSQFAQSQQPGQNWCSRGVTGTAAVEEVPHLAGFRGR